MEVKVIRGSNQIGGTIVEIGSKEARIIVDVGVELDDTNPPTVPQVDGLFQGDKKYDAVLISHMHMDHVGLSNYVEKEIPIYMAKKMYELHKFTLEYRGIDVLIKPVIFNENNQRLDGSYSFNIKDIKVTPYLCDHSAYDSYMYLLESDNDVVLYTGDFRSNGRKSFYALLNRLPNKVNKLICEGTTLSRHTNMRNKTEDKLVGELVEVMQGDKSVFVLTGSTNIDRIVSVYKASRRTKRIMAIDTYLAKVLKIIGGTIPTADSHEDIKVCFVGLGNKKLKELSEFRSRKIKRDDLVKKRFVMCIRSSEDMLKYIKGMSKSIDLKGSVLVYSMWRGYEKQETMKHFEKECRDLGIEIVYIHTSGHADEYTIKKLKETVNPDEVIPVHTFEPEKLKTI